MAEFEVRRIAGGKNAGKLKVTVEITMSVAEELRLAQGFGCRDEAKENLDQKTLQRGVGPVARPLALALLSEFEKRVQEGETISRRKTRRR